MAGGKIDLTGGQNLLAGEKIIFFFSGGKMICGGGKIYLVDGKLFWQVGK